MRDGWLSWSEMHGWLSWLEIVVGKVGERWMAQLVRDGWLSRSGMGG